MRHESRIVNNYIFLITILICNTYYISYKSKRCILRKSLRINLFFLYKYDVDIIPRKPRINYDWTMIYELEQYSGKCSPCIFKSVEPFHSNSSPRDVILTYAANMMLGAEIWVKSIRNSNCKAKIYIICDEMAVKRIIYQHKETFFKECGVAIAVFGNLPQFPHHKEWECFYMYRQAIRYDFLYKYQDEFDRILICDLFDTVFQGDPFTTKIKTNKIYMSIERSKWREIYGLKSSSCKMVGLVKFRRVMNNNIINGATIIGGYKAVMSLVEALCSTFDPHNYYTVFADDQEFINAIYYAKYIKLPYKMKLFNYSEGYANVCWWPRDRLNYTLGSFALEKNAIPPLVIHQYDKNTIYGNVKKSCPPYYNVKGEDYITNIKL